MALSKESADALRECIRIVAPRHSPDERRTMARNVEQYIHEGKWLPAFTVEHVAALYYPRDPGLEESLRTRILEAIRTGELVPAAGAGRLFASDLAGWPDCPRVPADSPLRHWLPAFMHEPAQAELPLEHWLQFDLWALREAAYLLCGRAPRDEDAFLKQDRDAGGPAGLAYRSLKDATLAGSLPFIEVDGVLARRRIKPADAVAWAIKREMPVPEELRQLVQAAPPRDRQPAPSVTAALDPTPAVHPMTTRELAQAFDGIEGRGAPGWARLLGDASACKWALPARLDPGRRGKQPATWDPVAFALLLERLKDVPRSELKRRFRTEPSLAEWREEWGRRIAALEAFGLDANDRQR